MVKVPGVATSGYHPMPLRGTDPTERIKTRSRFTTDFGIPQMKTDPVGFPRHQCNPSDPWLRSQTGRAR